MKKFMLAFLLAITFLTNITCFDENITVYSARFDRNNSIEQIVYRTETVNRYHVGSCRYLKYSKFKLEKSIAEKAGLTPCKICKPNLIY